MNVERRALLVPIFKLAIFQLFNILQLNLIYAKICLVGRKELLSFLMRELVDVERVNRNKSKLIALLSSDMADVLYSFLENLCSFSLPTRVINL